MHRFFVTSTFIFIHQLFTISYSSAVPLEPFEIRKSPISEFVQWVSVQSGENIILGRGVEGVISVHIKNLDSDDIIPLFNQVMNSNGYDVVLDDKGFYNVTIDQRRRVNLPKIFTKVYTLNHLTNTKAKQIFDSILLSASNDSNDVNKGSKDLASFSTSYHSVDILPSSNALLVSASSNQIDKLNQFISKIDKDMQQVVIEAVILETDLSNSESINVSLSSALSNNGFTALTNATNTNLSFGNSSEGGQVIFSKGGDIRAVLNAMSKNSNVKILSTPNILVMDREQGNISVGQNVPFLVSQEVTNSGNPVQQIERKDVGVTLRVVPHIVSSDEIILQITQESSSVTTSTQASDIITNKRLISTVAKVRNGQTIVLGGLVSDEERFFESGIPFLKDIPWLGRLFRSDRSEIVQRELTVMIKTLILI
jgi:general secretion pathway protein D